MILSPVEDCMTSGCSSGVIDSSQAFGAMLDEAGYAYGNLLQHRDTRSRVEEHIVFRFCDDDKLKIVIC